ncbi:MAG: Uma2 family endonuclease [Planctomycetes bacterium]|nr:Uma2 family endonuclease [Planctomycetota bacterium]
MSTTTLVTADQLLRMPDDGHRHELVAGVLRKMVPAGWKHGAVAGGLHGRLEQHVREHGLGQVFAAETGFLLTRDPDTVRAPDIAFIQKVRFEAAKSADAFWPGSPDLAVEVISPGDTISDVDDKVRMWLDAGTSVVWVVNPKWRNVTVYRSPTDIRTLTENEQLDGGDVVPGFSCRVGEIFAGT